MAKLISKIYGEALFELAKEERKLDVLFEEAKAIHEIFLQNPEFGKLMVHPKLLREEKAAVTEAVFKERVSSEMTGFLRLMIEKDRFMELEESLTFFMDRVKEEMQVGVAYVTTAIVLGKAARAKMKKRLIAITRYKEIEMHYTVDPSIIGGMVIRIGDRIIDSSIAAKLKELRKQLLSI